MIIYLVRHGESLPREQVSATQGASIGLSPKGKVQARAVARFLRRKRIGTVVSSPFARAKETADIIGAALGVPVKTDVRLREWESATLKGEEFAAARKCSRKEKDEPLPGGESFHASVYRFEEALKELTRERQNICIVAHEHIIGNVIMDLLDYSAPPPLGLASVSALRFEDGSFSPMFFNKKFLLLGRLLRRLYRAFFLAETLD